MLVLIIPTLFHMCVLVRPGNSCAKINLIACKTIYKMFMSKALQPNKQATNQLTYQTIGFCPPQGPLILTAVRCGGCLLCGMAWPGLVWHGMHLVAATLDRPIRLHIDGRQHTLIVNGHLDWQSNNVETFCADWHYLLTNNLKSLNNKINF